MSVLKKNDSILLVSVLALLSFLVPFLLRAFDDNRLTSWLWVFESVNGANVFLILALGIIAVLILHLKVTFSVRYPGLVLFIASFVISSFLWGVPEAIVDASRYFTEAKHLEVYGIRFFVHEWGRAIAPWTDLPLFPFVYGLIFTFVGESRIWVQMFTSLLFSLTVVMTYLVGRDLWNRDTGASAGMLLLGIPYLLIQVPLMLVDVPAMFSFTGAVLVFIRAIRHGGWRWTMLSSCSILLALLSKYSMWFFLLTLPVIVVVFLSPMRRACGSPVEGDVCGGHQNETATPNGHPGRGEVIRRSSLIALCSCILIGALIVLKYDVLADQLRFLATYQKPGLSRWGESFLSTFLFQIHPFITGLALYSAWSAFKKKDRTYLIISLMVGMVLAFQIKRIRYVIPLFPMIALMASYGLQRVRDREVRMFVVSCVLVSSLTVAFFAYLPFCKRMNVVNLKDAGKYLDSQGIENVDVYVSYDESPPLNPSVAVPLLDLYTHARIAYSDDPAAYTPDESVETSALRFTWQYRNPAYYRTGAARRGRSAIAVISDDMDRPLPDSYSHKLKGYVRVKIFDSDEGVFQYKTFVSVYEKEGFRESALSKYVVSKQ